MSRHHQPGQRLSIYERGRTTIFACRAEQRCAYCLYVPDSYAEDDDRVYPLIVLVHGTDRTAQQYRDSFAAFAEAHGCIVLAPLFPCGLIEPDDVDNYKFIKFHDMRFDHILLAMIAEIGARYRIDGERFLLHGFSGGGHFAHRFFYLHPHRLRAVSIGAPGVVTLLDPERDWWVGVRDLEAQFGIALNLNAMREVAVQMVVGADDTETWEITIPEGTKHWMPGANDAGRTRIDRLAALRASFERQGIAVRHDIVSGAGHWGFDVLEPVRAFFADVLAAAPSERSV